MTPTSRPHRPLVRALERRPLPPWPSWALLALLALLAASAARGDTPETRTFEGEWRWNQGATGDLEAHFTEREDGNWDVAFHFDFRRRPHVYRGTAAGDPGRGALSGTVRSEGGRTFSFEGRFREGRFDGEHAEVFRNDRKVPTGTLSLGSKAPTAI